MNEQIKKLVENQNKIVAKIREIEAKIELVLKDHENIVKRLDRHEEKISGIETILLDMGVEKKALELHQSFKVDKKEKA